MTSISITITPRRAWMSTDSAVCEATDADGDAMRGQCRATDDPAAIAAQFADPPVAPRFADRFGRKLGISPEKRILVAVSGLSAPLMCVCELGQSPAVASLDDIHIRAPYALRALSQERPREAHGIVFAVGWAAGSRRCTGFYFASDDDWTPRELPEGHAFLPRPYSGVKPYAALYELYQRPLGQDVDALHLAAGQAQAEAARRGLYASRPAIGGELLLGEVDEAGARERVLGVL